MRRIHLDASNLHPGCGWVETRPDQSFLVTVGTLYCVIGAGEDWEFPESFKRVSGRLLIEAHR